MIARLTWQAIAFACGVTALLVFLITYPAYLITFHRMWRPSVEVSLAGYAEYVLTLFVVPLLLFAVSCKAGFTLVIRRKITDVLLLFLLISFCEFISKIAGSSVYELGQGLLAYTPKMAKMAEGGIGSAISAGSTIGILAGAKANWTATSK